MLIEIDPVGPVAGAPMVTLTDPPPSIRCLVKSTSKFLGPDSEWQSGRCDVTIARIERRQALGVRWVSHLLQRLTLALGRIPERTAIRASR